MSITKVFLRKPQFTAYVKSIHPSFDAVKTNGLPRWYFKGVDGEVVRSRCAKELFKALNAEYGYFINVDKSLVRGCRWIVTFDVTSAGSANAPVEAAEGLVTTTPDDGIDVVPEAAVAPLTEVPTESPTESEVTVEALEDELCISEPDWEYVDAIEDSKEGKLELDAYAEQFDVKLSRTMKKKNMVAKFKTIWAANQK